MGSRKEARKHKSGSSCFLRRIVRSSRTALIFFLSFSHWEDLYGSFVAAIGVYPDRAPGGDCHHWSVDFTFVAGRAKGSRSGESHAMPEQLQADGHRAAQLPRHV